MQQMMQQMREERKQFMSAIQQMNQEEKGQQDDFMDEMQQRMMEQAFEENLSGKSDEELQEFANAIGTELAELKQHVAQDNGPSPGAEDPMAVAMMNMAQRNDVDPSTLAQMMKSANVDSDPEVQKKKIEQETEAMKMEQKKAMADKFMDSFEELAGSISEIGQLVDGGGGGGQQNQVQDQSQNGAIEEDIHTEAEEVDESDSFNMGDYAQGEPEEPAVETTGRSNGDGMDKEWAERTNSAGAGGGPDPEDIYQGGTVDVGHTDVGDEAEAEAGGAIDVGTTEDEGSGEIHMEAVEVVRDHGIDSQKYLKFQHHMTERGYSDDDASEAWNDLTEQGEIPKGTRNDNDEQLEADGGAETEEEN